MKKILIVLILVLGLGNNVFGQNFAQQLQDISVTIKAGSSQGSGTIITRSAKTSENSKKEETVNFVWTAAHVVDHVRKIRTVVDPKSGQEKKIIEFGPCSIVKELVENGRRVGELNMEAKVIKYSDADNGHDLALLMLYKRNFISTTASFYLDKEIPEIGTELVHVGSLLGQLGSNSMTTGIVSQVGRVLNVNGSNSVVFDQTTATAFPGSSGGPIFLANGNNKGKYVGMLVRGAGETFNLIVPVRRMRKWAEDNKIEWALDEAVPMPSLDIISKMTIEDDININTPGYEKSATPKPNEFKFWIKINEENIMDKFNLRR